MHIVLKRGLSELFVKQGILPVVLDDVLLGLASIEWFTALGEVLHAIA